MPLPSHFFVSSDDGALYDTRAVGWSRMAPLRKAYVHNGSAIGSAAELKGALRYGPYAWPGGYPRYFVMGDGESMSFESVRTDFCRVLEGMRNNESDWTPVAVKINYENSELYCCHSNKRIESAYAENDAETEES